MNSGKALYIKEIGNLPTDGSGFVIDPTKRERLHQEAQKHLNKINAGTHYQGTTVLGP